MRFICTNKLWTESIVVRLQKDGSVIYYSMRDRFPRSSNAVVFYGVKNKMSSMSNLINMLLEIYEEVIISRK